jgi:hypothetical protein
MIEAGRLTPPVEIVKSLSCSLLVIGPFIDLSD